MKKPLASAVSLSTSSAFGADVKGVIRMPADQLKWQPMGSTGASVAWVVGDGTAKGPVVLFMKYPAGFDSGWHTHDGNYVATVVKGTMTAQGQGYTPQQMRLAYGANEAFDGRDGLPRFVKGLETLLDTLAPTKARVVLLSPTRQEDLGRPLPDPAAHNKNLRLYADAIRDIARQRIDQKFSAPKMVDNMLSVYESLLTQTTPTETPASQQNPIL